MHDFDHAEVNPTSVSADGANSGHAHNDASDPKLTLIGGRATATA
jgi:hypothetical protein